ncbi:MAG: hypothetical protein HZB44_05395 [Actinobacteria bacterium]|nr:hypothetical protein [Actinomycetota bacterium]
MKRTAAIMVLLTVLVSTSLLVPAAALAIDSSLSWPVRGFDYPSWWHDEYLDQSSSVSLTRIASTGSNA